MTVLTYPEGSKQVDEIHLYNTSLRKETTPTAINVMGDMSRGTGSVDVASKYKVKDLIHNSQENDKKLLNISERTRFSLGADGEALGTKAAVDSENRGSEGSVSAGDLERVKDSLPEVLAGVVGDATEAQRGRIADLARENGWDFGSAAAAYASELAGKDFLTREEREFLGAVVSGLEARVGSGLGRKGLEYAVWDGGRKKSGDVFDLAEDTLMRRQKGVSVEDIERKSLGFGDEEADGFMGHHEEPGVDYSEFSSTAPSTMAGGNRGSSGSDLQVRLAKARKGCGDSVRALHRAASGGGDTEAAMTGARVSMQHYIRTALDYRNMPAVKKRELNAMLASVADIGSAAELEMSMQKVDGIVTDVDTRMQMRAIDKLIGTKILDKDANGISKAKAVDDDTRKGMLLIRSELRGVMATEIDADLKALDSEIRHLEEARRNGEAIDEEHLSDLKEDQRMLQAERETLRDANMAASAAVDYKAKIAELEGIFRVQPVARYKKNNEYESDICIMR